jgi:hypothetical protein
MKPITRNAYNLPGDLLHGHGGLLLGDVAHLGMIIRNPSDYNEAIRTLPTGRAFRRLLAKQSKKRGAAC